MIIVKLADWTAENKTAYRIDSRVNSGHVESAFLIGAGGDSSALIGFKTVKIESEIRSEICDVLYSFSNTS